MVRENWKGTCKRMKLDYCFSPCTKINSKWIKDLKIRPETISYTEENIGTKLMDLSLKGRFYEFDPKGKGSKGHNK